MTVQIYKTNEDKSTTRTIELPTQVANAIEKLDPSCEMDVDNLCMLLDRTVFTEICEFLAVPSQTKNTFDELHFRFLNLATGNLDAYYDKEIVSFFQSNNNLLKACISYHENQKGGQK